MSISATLLAELAGVTRQAWHEGMGRHGSSDGPKAVGRALGRRLRRRMEPVWKVPHGCWSGSWHVRRSTVLKELRKRAKTEVARGLLVLEEWKARVDRKGPGRPIVLPTAEELATAVGLRPRARERRPGQVWRRFVREVVRSFEEATKWSRSCKLRWFAWRRKWDSKLGRLWSPGEAQLRRLAATRMSRPRKGWRLWGPGTPAEAAERRSEERRRDDWCHDGPRDPWERA